VGDRRLRGVGRGLKPVKEDLAQLKMRMETVSRQLDEMTTRINEIQTTPSRC